MASASTVDDASYSVVPKLLAAGIGIGHGEAPSLSSEVTRRCLRHLGYLAEKKLDSLYYLASDEAHPRQRLYQRIWSVQREGLGEVLRELERSRVPVAVFKGAEFVAGYFRDQAIACANDVDLLVPRDDLARVKRILFALSYCQGDFDPSTMTVRDADIVEVAALEARHYELYPFKKFIDIEAPADELQIVGDLGGRVAWRVGEKCRVLVEVDVHFRVAIDIPAEPFFEHAVPSSLGLGSTFCVTDHLWFQTSRFYQEVALHGKTSLRDFVFIGMLLRDRRVDWGRLVSIAESYSLHSSLYYFLVYMDAIVGGLPGEVKVALEPTRGPRHHDWGFQVGKLLGYVEQPPRPV